MPSSVSSTLPAAPSFGMFHLVQGCLLAFTAGFVDVVGFCALFGLFTAHVTGNFVMIGVELAVASTKLTVEAVVRHGREPTRLLLLAEALLLVTFMTAGLLALPIQSADNPATIVVGLIGVAAMGVQNAKARIVLSDHAPTTIMTGNTTQVVIDLVELATPGSTQKSGSRARLRKMVPPLIGFATGAMLGALAFSAVSFWCVLPPIFILTGLAAASR